MMMMIALNANQNMALFFVFQIWNVHSVLNVLYSLVEKSKINHQVCPNFTATLTKKKKA